MSKPTALERLAAVLHADQDLSLPVGAILVLTAIVKDSEGLPLLHVDSLCVF